MPNNSSDRQNNMAVHEARRIRFASADDRPTGLKPAYDTSWAVVIGVNNYQHFTPLNYAVNDAIGIARLLIDDLGFQRDQVLVLLDQPPSDKELPFDLAGTEASKSAIEALLFTRLPEQSGRDDRVLIFFAGHGESRKLPGKRERGYLIPANGKPGEWHTFINMDTVMEAGDLLEAKHVFYLLDACFSGLATARSGVTSSRFQTDMLTNRARQVLTAGTAKQSVADVGAGGHSPFTNHILNGLRGDARQTPDSNAITASDLMVYVKNRVGQAGDSKQTPDFGTLPGHESGGDFIFVLPDAISAHDRVRLAKHLIEVGRLLDDKGRFRSACIQLEKGLEQADRSGLDLPEAHFYLGQARLAMDDAVGAIKALNQAVDQVDEALQADTCFLQIIALAKQGEDERMASSIDCFRTDHENDWRANWLREMRYGLVAGTRRALLIGIGEYADPWSVSPLPGPSNDLDLARQVLSEHLAFPVETIIELRDKEATRQGILNALAKLHNEVAVNDTVVIWFSGHAIPTGDPAYLLPHDYDVQSGKNGITAAQWHDLMKDIPAAAKVVVLDTHANQELIDLARRDRLYTLCLAEDQPNDSAAEISIDDRFYGLFSYYLLNTLAQEPTADFGHIEQQVKKAITDSKRSRQVPLFLGTKQMALFRQNEWSLLEEAFKFSLRQNYDAMTLGELEAVETRFSIQPLSSYPPLHASLGRGFLAKNAFLRAQKALEQVDKLAATTSYRYPELSLMLATTYLRQQQYTKAHEILKTFQGETNKEWMTLPDEVLPLMETLSDNRLHALLVGVPDQRVQSPSPSQGALNDVDAMKRLLIDGQGVHEDEITVLINEQATRSAIELEFRKLVEWSKEGPALFFYAGYGSRASDGWPSIVAYDAEGTKSRDDLRLSDLSQWAGVNSNLVTIIDAGWIPGMKLPWGASWGSRFIETFDIWEEPWATTRNVREDPWSTTRGIVKTAMTAGRLGASSNLINWKRDDNWSRSRDEVSSHLRALQIGRVTFYPASIHGVFDSEQAPPSASVSEAEFPSPFDDGQTTIHGALTYNLINSILEILGGREDQSAPNGAPEIDHLKPVNDTERTVWTTYDHLENTLRLKLKWLQPFIVGGVSTERLLSNAVGEEKIQTIIREQVFEKPLRQAEALLTQLTEGQQDPDPEALLNLGVIYAARGDYDRSIDLLKQIPVIDISKLEEIDALLPEKKRDYKDQRATSDDALYHLGCVRIFSGGDLDKAATELRDAIKGDPGNAPAHYYLGIAIRTRVEQQQLVEAEEAWQRYLELGAPLGHKDEVDAFLKRRSGTGNGGPPSTIGGSFSSTGTGSGTPGSGDTRLHS